jgi:hypothetical protein
VRVRLHAPHHAGDVAFGVDHERGTLDAHRLLAVHVSLLPDAVLLRDVVSRVRQQREGERVLLLELRVRRLIVGADAEDDGTAVTEVRVDIPDAARLRRASRCVVFGIEVEDDRPAVERRESDARARVARELEVRCRLALLDHRSDPILRR